MSEKPTVGVVLTEEEKKVLEGIDAGYLNALQWPGGPEDPEVVQFYMQTHESLKAILTRHAEAQAGEWVAVRRETLAAVRMLLWHANRDIGEWMHLANRQRDQSPDCTRDPLCATDAALAASRKIAWELARAASEIGQAFATPENKE